MEQPSTVDVPPRPPAMVGASPAGATPPGRSRWWIALAVFIALIVVGGCAALFVALARSDAGVGGDAVALIHIDGVIAGTGSPVDGIVTPQRFLEQLERAEDDDSVRAILIRVDSPGGTVAASQECAMAVAAIGKPVVVSVGDICASGAYMIASQADEIVASPGSSVGSIGVIMEIPNVSGLLDKLGVEFTVLTEGEHKDVGSPYRSVTGTEAAMLQRQMRLVYERFITDVAKGRRMERQRVAELATGWVWLGTEAKDLGLVDRIGTYRDALERAAELGGIEGEPRVVEMEPEPSIANLLSALLEITARLRPLDASALERVALPR